MDRPEGVSVRLTAPPPPSDSGFNHPFKLAYVVTLAPHQLSTDLHIVNTSDKDDFIFQALLHTYLAVPDASKIKITGVEKGVTYKDKTQGMKVCEATGEPVVIDKEVDRYVCLSRSKHRSNDARGKEPQLSGYRTISWAMY